MKKVLSYFWPLHFNILVQLVLLFAVVSKNWISLTISIAVYVVIDVGIFMWLYRNYKKQCVRDMLRVFRVNTCKHSNQITQRGDIRGIPVTSCSDCGEILSVGGSLVISRSGAHWV